MTKSIESELINKMQELIDALNRQLQSCEQIISTQNALITNLEAQISILKLREPLLSRMIN